jgi:hypothetical protein
MQRAGTRSHTAGPITPPMAVAGVQIFNPGEAASASVSPPAAYAGTEPKRRMSRLGYAGALTIALAVVC